ncbi:hypothetical protein [Cupriavidus sp. D384]|uniref:hypothetical protein n=1 Tax=Cupriavidus sp. D384 TaxID=1538095 RepID=UPI0012E7A862|nr:hypothetical protein [Cupriavidus sp. D384]
MRDSETRSFVVEVGQADATFYARMPWPACGRLAVLGDYQTARTVCRRTQKWVRPAIFRWGIHAEMGTLWAFW